MLSVSQQAHCTEVVSNDSGMRLGGNVSRADALEKCENGTVNTGYLVVRAMQGQIGSFNGTTCACAQSSHVQNETMRLTKKQLKHCKQCCSPNNQRVHMCKEQSDINKCSV